MKIVTNLVIELYAIRKYKLTEDIADKLRKITFKNPETKRSNTMLTALASPDNPYHTKAQKIAATYRLAAHKQGQTTVVDNTKDIDAKDVHKIMKAFGANDEEKVEVNSILKERDPIKFTQKFKQVVNPETPDEDIKTIYSLWNGDKATTDAIVKKYNFGNEADLAKRLEKTVKKVKQTKTGTDEFDLPGEDFPVDNGEYKPDRSYKPSDDIEGFQDTPAEEDNWGPSASEYDFGDDYGSGKDDNSVWDMMNSDEAKDGKTHWGKIIAIGLSCLLLGGLFKGITNIFSDKKDRGDY